MGKHSDEIKASKDMTADEAAVFAMHTIFQQSFEKAGCKFLYDSLTKDKFCPLGLYVMFNFLQMFFSDDTIKVFYSYSLSRIPAGDESLGRFESSMNQFLASGSEFEPRLEPRLAPVIDSVDPAEQDKFLFACRTFVGHIGEALEHKTNGAGTMLNSFDEYYHQKNFRETEKYREFLESKTTYADDYVERPEPEYVPTPFDPDA